MPKQFSHVQFGNACPSIIQRSKCVLKNFKLFSLSFQSQHRVLCTHVHTYTPVFWGEEFFQHNRHSKLLILSLILKEVDRMVKQSWLTAYGNMALALVKGVISTYWKSSHTGVQPYLRSECKPTSEDLNSIYKIEAVPDILFSYSVVVTALTKFKDTLFLIPELLYSK